MCLVENIMRSGENVDNNYFTPFPTITSPNPYNSLPNDKTINWWNLKALVDNNLNVATIAKLVFDRVESIVGKDEKCWPLHHFHLFPQCFRKLTFLQLFKVRIVL